jgi:hypothetical protein
MTAAAVAIVIRREREVVEACRRAGAISAATARPLRDLGLSESRGVDRLKDRAVLRMGAPGTWYLDEPAFEALRRMRHRLILVLMVASAAVLLGGLVTLGALG